MRRTFPRAVGLCVALVVVQGLRASPPVAPTEALSPEEERAKFKLPPGFEIQLVAAEPDIHKPMNIAFDARGRLWVTDTVEYPWPAKEGTTPRDSVKILSDFDDNGRARKVEKFTGGLNIPLGVLPLNDDSGGAIVYGIPNVFRISDRDGDGRADKRDVLLGGAIGSEDTHGMTNNFVRGFDGWVYADHGFKNTSVVKGSDGSEVKMNSGNVYRFKIDGSRVEQFTHGQVNPFGLAFDPLGNLFSADCHTRPQYMLLRGAYYESFGKPHDGLGFGPEMIRHDHGSTGIAGTLYYAAEQFPPEFRGNLFNGNPVTNKINRDTIEWHGSSPWAVEQEDFLTCDDPWFRPVQVVLGPDGAMWVADFYNKIIGHYEVDLKHPGRDRERGRIWRIVYRGDAEKAPPPKLPDFTKMSTDELAAAMGDANLAVRMLAMHRLTDAVARDAGETAVKAVLRPRNPHSVVHGLWARFRLGLLTEEELTFFAGDRDRTVRTHVMRILSETTAWTPALRALALAGLNDTDPFVQRCAADALGRHPQAENLRPLLDLRPKVPARDTHLLHTIKMSVRNQLAAPGTLAKLDLRDLAPPDARLAMEVAVAVPSAEAASFLVRNLGGLKVDRDTASKYLKHAARYLPEGDVDALASLVKEKFGDDLDLQLELFKSIREGLQQRGTPVTGRTREWGGRLATQILASPADEPADWSNRPVEGTSRQDDPWVVQARDSADGNKGSPFFSSLPKGEQLTGVLRSRPFECPPRLTFWAAGHNGLPPGKRPVKNVFRLRLSHGGRVLAEGPPPRNDLAQKVTWDLKRHAGEQVYFEATDADAADGYAWLAFGRFDPPVAPVPPVGSGTNVLARRQESAAEIAAALKLTELAGAVQKLVTTSGADAAARAAAVKSLAALDPQAAVAPLGALLQDAATPSAVRDAAAAALAGVDGDAARAALAGAFVFAPQAAQQSMATVLAASPAGAEALLTAVAQGKASPRLLTLRPVRDRLRQSNPDKVEERLQALTRGLIDADETIEKVMSQRRDAFRAASAEPGTLSPEKGRLVFQKNCAACHRVDNEGAQVGPQLDGIGKRGPDRLIEDILDPSRNVDLAFRASILTLDDGDVLSGLQRREEGEAVVFADAQGKEFTLPKSRIRKRVESQLSLMPGNFAELIPPEDFNHMMAYLLAK